MVTGQEQATETKETEPQRSALDAGRIEARDCVQGESACTHCMGRDSLGLARRCVYKETQKDAETTEEIGDV